MADSETVQVFCRVRPPNEREGGGLLPTTKKCVTVPSSDPLQQTVLLQLKGMANSAPKAFAFDRVFNERSTQNEVFEIVGVPVTQACLQGYNGTIFAYGQTGSGKTFTMQGPDDVIDADARALSDRELALRGLVPRVFDYLFRDEAHTAARSDGVTVQHTFACSFMEIYNERVYDLLDHGSTRDSAGLTLRESGRKGVVVEGIIESVVTSAKQAAELMAIGAQNRRVGQTAMNREEQSIPQRVRFAYSVQGDQPERHHKDKNIPIQPRRSCGFRASKEHGSCWRAPQRSGQYQQIAFSVG
ncbi:hypothetical protein PINS_up015436 [Pythium insidiosum]|nr:hypothetical protein PINS_up015436 [Pythium insidiosum]